MLGRMEQICRRGRVRGFRPWLITQRPASLHKSVLSQANTLIAMQLTAPQDRDALGDWIEGQASREEGKRVLAELPKLAKGEGFLWAPHEDLLERVRFPKIATYDSSRTPEEGEQLPQIEAREGGPLGDRREAARARGPGRRGGRGRGAARARGELEEQLAAPWRPAASEFDQATSRPPRLELQPGTSAAAPRSTLPQALERTSIAERLRRWQGARTESPRSEACRPRARSRASRREPDDSPVRMSIERANPDSTAARKFPGKTRINPDKAGPARAASAVLTAIAQHRGGVTREQITVLTGYKRSTRDAYIQRLRERGLVEDEGSTIVATPAGVEGARRRLQAAAEGCRAAPVLARSTARGRAQGPRGHHERLARTVERDAHLRAPRPTSGRRATPTCSAWPRGSSSSPSGAPRGRARSSSSEEAMAFMRCCFVAGHTAGIEATHAFIQEGAVTQRARAK
jgi:hypothetical protein